MTDSDAAPAPDDLDFESALKQLERIVQTLEQGEVPLEKSLELYEQGTKLKAICDDKLESARAKIEKITLDGAGKAAGTQPLDVE
ncbi:exodeoxyribonuclease VII small subunit [Pacificimonas sp. WHA3]|uniref:Exodeoxyribonuclease 7 small subunit n=1 Tax=Pacificimonas pallii TaxID=2827236 RepID=A0ABS6SDA8_9SPHN|nr:exodeoxyribonuclease VII small subunit [Pacificimonas pallii]MBV7256083.1 exodeoxyribonuclease VII small subunit [Pacificimonas pallii]